MTPADPPTPAAAPRPTPTAAAEAAEAGAGAADDLERALLELRALGRSAVARYRGHCGRAAAPVEELAGGPAAVPAAAARLAGRARSTVEVILAVDAGPGLAAGADALLAAAGPAVRVRVLCSPRTAAAGLRAGAAAPAAVDLRVGRVRALDAVVADGRVALTRSDDGGAGSAIVVRSGPVVRAVADLFDGVWRGAPPAPDPIDLGGPDRAAFAAQVLRLLYAGYPDEAAAQELAVSVRTYRRHVAEIVAAVGARSRFQAGMRAAAAGLLPPPQ